ncbi:sugar phosphate nucleotidyltransferase [Halalkalicoccus sp. NIPERK01]|uniref:sugar phosphate nucleotidyltransferase n=1 Tax=Halalkalicoccus sp. NIPERK01 TaxID=3053469 RepID=UPI00256F4E05|nr:sugar phosphate nucleotidyltransferase [Halalkalicoccus sp. NIPERK01]MDL5361652.1 sugar phosphate nucleotidyltransferase [Halalkalicoccus sp. NIPERK01]
MDALVFAAGEGTRLRPLTATKPKPMLEVGGEPILTRCLRTLTDLGARRLIVVVGYCSDLVTDYYGDSFSGIPIEYVHQHKREGMAHALLTAADRVSGDVMLMDGDSVFDCDLSSLVECHRKRDVDGTVLLERVPREAARSKAICSCDNESTIHRIVNRPDDPPDPSYVAAGFQTATPALIDACRRVERSPRGEYEMAAAIQYAIDNGERLLGIEPKGWHLNVNTPADLERAREYFEN